MKQFKTLTLLLLATATLLAVACKKDDTDSYGSITPTESDIIGTWYFPWDNSAGNYYGESLDIKSNHKMTVGELSTREYDWTFANNKVEGYIEFDERDQPQGTLWWEKVTLNIKEFKKEQFSKTVDKFNMTVEGMITSTYYGDVDTSSVFNCTLTRTRNNS